MKTLIVSVTLTAAAVITAIGISCGKPLSDQSSFYLRRLDNVQNAYQKASRDTIRWGWMQDQILPIWWEQEDAMEAELRQIDTDCAIFPSYKRWEVMVKYTRKTRQSVLERSGLKGEALKELEAKLAGADRSVEGFLKEVKPR